ncbi:SGNH/GDSL hydrolase family protein [Kordia sp.]|uniref:SGNH/GDSL hydrolase family protein n=1 Tax=Kordia sp. TaxID=1965332 RepID=UPI003D6BB7C9
MKHIFKILSRNRFFSQLRLLTHKKNLLNWRVFANIMHYEEANFKLKSHTKAKGRVIFMGDSITENWVEMRPEFFKGRDYINRGIGGQTTPQILLRFRQDVVDLNPRVVVILAGTNDVAGNTGNTSIETIVGNIKSMVEIANANDIEVIISSILPVKEYFWKPEQDPASKIILINEKLKSYAEEKGVIYLDYYSSMVDDKGGLKVPDYTAANDLVHPNKAGYLVMEKLAQIAIDRALIKYK